MTRRAAAEPGVVRITLAPRPHSDELEQRVVRYLISMAVRTACVVLVIVVHHPVRWVFAAGAVLLPYVAVLLANATDRRTQVRDSRHVDRRGLAGSAQAGQEGQGGQSDQAGQDGQDPRRAPAGEVLIGVVVQPPAGAQP